MKAYVRMLEAAVAIFLVYTFLIILSSGRAREDRPEDLKLRAYELLEGLDDQGVLRGYAAANDYASIDAAIDYEAHNHTVNVCEPDGSCHGQIPNGTDVWVGSYILAGQSSYNPKLVKLYIY
jgi:hypothetical protein